MGAFVAFGVYVFIGVKGNLGLFDIGALVMYCGAFYADRKRCYAHC